MRERKFAATWEGTTECRNSHASGEGIARIGQVKFRPAAQRDNGVRQAGGTVDIVGHAQRLARGGQGGEDEQQEKNAGQTVQHGQYAEAGTAVTGGRAVADR